MSSGSLFMRWHPWVTITRPCTSQAHTGERWGRESLEWENAVLQNGAELHSWWGVQAQAWTPKESSWETTVHRAFWEGSIQTFPYFCSRCSKFCSLLFYFVEDRGEQTILAQRKHRRLHQVQKGSCPFPPLPPPQEPYYCHPQLRSDNHAFKCILSHLESLRGPQILMIKHWKETFLFSAAAGKREALFNIPGEWIIEKKQWDLGFLHAVFLMWHCQARNKKKINWRVTVKFWAQ